MSARVEVDLTGCFDIVYSPDDAASSGMGYYVELLWKRKDSPLFASRSAAAAWARRNGGTRCLRG